MARKRTEVPQQPTVSINFKDKSANILRILKRATQNIYKKNLVDQIQDEKRHKLEMKDIRDHIIAKKKLRVQRFEAKLDTLELDEIDLHNIKFRMSPEIRGTMLRLTPLESSPTKYSIVYDG